MKEQGNPLIAMGRTIDRPLLVEEKIKKTIHN